MMFTETRSLVPSSEGKILGVVKGTGGGGGGGGSRDAHEAKFKALFSWARK